MKLWSLIVKSTDPSLKKAFLALLQSQAASLSESVEFVVRALRI
jgi:hypothetical protein